MNLLTAPLVYVLILGIFAVVLIVRARPNAAADDGNHVPTRAETFEKVVGIQLAKLPGVGQALATVYEDELVRRRARFVDMAETVFSHFEGSTDDFVHRAEDVPRLGSLSATAVEAAARTTVDAKARALGLLLAEAASTSDEREIDERELLILALADLDWPHISGLQQLARFPSDDELRTREGTGEAELSETTPERMERLSAAESLPSPVLAALLRHGLVKQESGYDLYLSGVTPFGRTLLDYLQQAAVQQPERK